MIIAELTKFFLHFPQIFFPTGNLSRKCGDFQRIFSQNLHISAAKRGENDPLMKNIHEFTPKRGGNVMQMKNIHEFTLKRGGNVLQMKNIHEFTPKHGGNVLHTQQLFLCHLCYSTNKIPHTMKKKILPIIISIFWIAFFSYLTYIKMYAVVILSLILLSMTMAMSVSNEAES